MKAAEFYHALRLAEKTWDTKFLQRTKLTHDDAFVKQAKATLQFYMAVLDKLYQKNEFIIWTPANFDYLLRDGREAVKQQFAKEYPNRSDMFEVVRALVASLEAYSMILIDHVMELHLLKTPTGVVI